MLRSCLALILMAAVPVTAHAHENESRMTTSNGDVCISSNGVPNHDIGQFPNRANPNSFEAQTLRFCFPGEPRMAGKITHGLMTVGVSLTGVPFRPYTAGYYDENGRRGISDNPASGWRQQAMHTPRALGMDTQNGHVDRSGLYHYHAMSTDYLASVGGTHIGYAPDGFEIHYAPYIATSSWELKPGTRQTAPFGAHDGTFEEDFEYSAGAGTLDTCNGAMMNGTYTYFVTDTYPYFPRCFKGVVSDPFMQRR